MPGSINGLMSSLRISSDSIISSSVGRASGTLFEALDLAAAASQLEKAGSLEALGSPRAIRVGMAKFDSFVSPQLKLCAEELGDTDWRAKADIEHFIERGQMPGDACGEDFVVQLGELNVSDTEQTPISRMRSVIDAGVWLLEKANEHGSNVANVAVRTGPIVILTSVLRDYVAFHVEKAISEGDSPEAVRNMIMSALAMIGPGLILFGAVRDEVAATANLKTRLGRVLMFAIFVGSFIAAQLTGASSSLLTAQARVCIYTLIRDFLNAFFPLNDNIGAPSSKAVTLSMAGYGVVQFLLAELAALMPLNGAARHAAGLDFNFFADLLHSVTNGLGAVVDDYLLPLCKHWFPIADAVGLDCRSPDPESLHRTVLEVRAGLRLPTSQQLGNALFSASAARTTAFTSIICAVFAAAFHLADSEFGENAQARVLNVVLAGMLMLIYFPFIHMCSQRPVQTPAQLSENITP